MARVLVWRQPDVWGLAVADTLRRERRRTRVHAVPRERALDALAWALTRHFTHVALFHGCRPVDASAYYREGIRKHDATVVERARAFFRSQQTPGTAIEAAIAATDLTLDQGRVFLALDEEHVVKYAGHYLIYGSESIMAIAATLKRMGYPDTKLALAQVGRPALFKCNIPMAVLNFEARRQIAATLYQAFRRARGRLPQHVSAVDHTVVLRDDVLPEAISSHTEPAEIVDWHRGGTPYRILPPA